MAFTVLFVLQPDYGGTIQKAIQRLGGTILGVILATPIVLQIQDINLLIIILIILAARKDSGQGIDKNRKKCRLRG